MTFQRLQELITGYREGYLSEKELEELSQALQQKEYPEEWANEIRLLLRESSVRHTANPAQDQEIWEHIEARREISSAPVRRLFSRKKLGWAAAIIFLLCASGYLLWQPAVNRYEHAVSKQLINKIEPATQGAVLTLEDGTQMVLDSMVNGVIASQGGGTDLLLQDGSLVYNADNSKTAVAYNTLQTPKGRQFNIRLPDGSIVWLNAASSIRYPVAFTENERRVEITGEVYFEVAPDKNKPFFVNVQNTAEIRVTGTYFNVNAYEDEATFATTLLSGAVAVRSLAGNAPAQEPVLLQPGEQAKLHRTTHVMEQVKDVDVNQVMAWKKGMFNFNEASLQQVMRQLSRWYNLTIEYEEGVPDMQFGGMMGRNLKLADVLDFLEGARVKFKMKEERQLIVLSADH